MAKVAAKKPQAQKSSRTRSIAFIALSIAVMAVSAWVVVPLGPIPFTLQMFAMTFAIVVLSPVEAVCAVLGYLVLGAIGVPVFSSMRGGIGVLMGPTGGFLWGYFFGVIAGVALLWVVRRARGERALTERRPDSTHVEGTSRALVFLHNFGFEMLAGVLFTAVAYLCGWFQYQIVAGADPVQAFLVCCAPFIGLDSCKIVAAVLVAEAVRKAVGR